MITATIDWDGVNQNSWEFDTVVEALEFLKTNLQHKEFLFAMVEVTS